jgi:hypothetical protein
MTSTRSGAWAAVEGLLAGPPAGSTSAIPSGVRLITIGFANGVASATFTKKLGRPTRSAQAQIVATISHSGASQRVRILVEGVGPVSLERGDGSSITGGARTADYVDLTAAAPIFVAAPARDSTASSPLHLRGTADVFEATFELEVRVGGHVVSSGTIMASSGTGTRGTWAATIAVPHGNITVVLFEASAKDGSRIHTTTVPLHVR